MVRGVSTLSNSTPTHSHTCRARGEKGVREGGREVGAHAHTHTHTHTRAQPTYHSEAGVCPQEQQHACHNGVADVSVETGCREGRVHPLQLIHIRVPLHLLLFRKESKTESVRGDWLGCGCGVRRWVDVSVCAGGYVGVCGGFVFWGGNDYMGPRAHTCAVTHKRAEHMHTHTQTPLCLRSPGYALSPPRRVCPPSWRGCALSASRSIVSASWKRPSSFVLSVCWSCRFCWWLSLARWGWAAKRDKRNVLGNQTKEKTTYVLLVSVSMTPPPPVFHLFRSQWVCGLLGTAERAEIGPISERAGVEVPETKSRNRCMAIPMGTPDSRIGSERN